jgi:hypothetical protein
MNSAFLVGEKAKFQSLIPFALEDWARAIDIDRNKFLGAVGWPFVLLSMGANLRAPPAPLAGRRA